MLIIARRVNIVFEAIVLTLIQHAESQYKIVDVYSKIHVYHAFTIQRSCKNDI